MNLRIKKTHKQHQEEEALINQEIFVKESKIFMQTLENLRLEILARDEAYAKAKQSGDKADMENYHQLARVISQKCLDYGRELCEAPIPRWVEGNLSKDNVDITKYAYDVIRNKICASLSVFDNDLMPSIKILKDFVEGRY